LNYTLKNNLINILIFSTELIIANKKIKKKYTERQ